MKQRASLDMRDRPKPAEWRGALDLPCGCCTIKPPRGWQAIPEGVAVPCTVHCLRWTRQTVCCHAPAVVRIVDSPGTHPDMLGVAACVTHMQVWDEFCCRRRPGP